MAEPDPRLTGTGLWRCWLCKTLWHGRQLAQVFVDGRITPRCPSCSGGVYASGPKTPEELQAA
jgi:hypothetical protein